MECVCKNFTHREFIYLFSFCREEKTSLKKLANLSLNEDDIVKYRINVVKKNRADLCFRLNLFYDLG